jgi:hypothetical protein
MQAMRTGMVGLAVAGLLGLGPARAGTETFEGTGLTNVWVEAGAFTGSVSQVAWTFAHANGYPTVYTNNPSLALQTGSTTNKGWLLSQTLTGGVGRVSGAFKQLLTDAVDCDVRINGTLIGNHESGGTQGVVEVASFEAFDPATRMPYPNDFTVMVSNRLAGSGRVALDDLTWEPFRLFVRLDRTGTNTAYVGNDFDAVAEVFDIGQPVAGGWSIQPAFAGTVSDTNALSWTLIPAENDVGQTFTATYVASDSDGTGYTHQASFELEVRAGPRLVDFERADFGYNTNSGVVTNLNGMNWTFLNVQTSDSQDRRIGTTSSRFRHTTALAGSMESQDSFAGIGTVSLHYAYFGSNRVVTFALQIHGDGEEWTTVPGGTFNVQDHEDITNSVFSVDVQRSDDVWIRLVTTGNADERANIDDLYIREYGDVLPRLAWSGETNAPVGRETVLDFTLLNAEGIVREWDYSISPSNATAIFEVTAEDQLQLRFSPADTNEWGDYAVDASASIGGEVAGETSVVIRVVSAPTFELAPVETNIAVPGIVDVWVTNVVLHGTNQTEWSTEWEAAPLFSNLHSVSNKSRFRIAAGTTEADAGAHTLTAVLTDPTTGVKTTNAVVLTVAGSGGATNEVYPILSFDITNHLVISGKVGRVFIPFGTTNLTMGAEESNWVWQGAAVTNTDGADVMLAITNTPDPRLFFYGVKVRPAP